MQFPFAKPTGIKANLATKEITLTFRVPLNDDIRAEAEKLSIYAMKDMPGVTLSIIPMQPPLVGMSVLNPDHEPAVRKSKQDPEQDE